ncbi:hydrogenase maturation nickel metallochaperone HypA [Haloarcula laminariae]|uniref:hydrogenase maturation nickel metallochaperone HypA n=1 Tax=Haloarcula laminariae TaxID=2961577 RepID=UPI0021C60F7D|nr:hydrogenase maturation nickel metallochaperone HypA [Halomicroarcula laminariae]
MTLEHRTEQRPAKTRLFCPACGHESPLDGDWIGDDRTARRRLLCPSCGDPVVDQPQV